VSPEANEIVAALRAAGQRARQDVTTIPAYRITPDRLRSMRQQYEVAEVLLEDDTEAFLITAWDVQRARPLARIFVLKPENA
jgi:hypothetical protein